MVEVKQESKSAKSKGGRDSFNEILKELSEGKYNSLLTWAPDRLSRNAGDLGDIVDLMDSGKLMHIRTHGQTFTNTPNEKFLLMILCSQAKLENDNRGKNVKRGLRAKCQQGKRPGLPPLGYKLYRDPEDYSKESQIVVDEQAAPFIKKMFEYVVHKGYSGRQVNDYLFEEGFRTRKGKRVTLSMTYRIFREAFYYGEFEFPKGSGDWYKGSHQPLIEKDLWERANKMLKTFKKAKWGSKDFYFSRLFKCGTCGSGICGEKRINRHGKEYLYYKCTKYGGRSKCHEKYIREEKLVESIAGLIDSLKGETGKLSEKISKEVDKLNAIQRMTMGVSAPVLNSAHYIQYVLSEGSHFEKKKLLSCLEGQLTLKEGKVFLLKKRNKLSAVI